LPFPSRSVALDAAPPRLACHARRRHHAGVDGRICHDSERPAPGQRRPAGAAPSSSELLHSCRGIRAVSGAAAGAVAVVPAECSPTLFGYTSRLGLQLGLLRGGHSSAWVADHTHSANTAAPVRGRRTVRALRRPNVVATSGLRAAGRRLLHPAGRLKGAAFASGVQYGTNRCNPTHHLSAAGFRHGRGARRHVSSSTAAAFAAQPSNPGPSRSTAFRW
jgi:hypothetical protein